LNAELNSTYNAVGVKDFDYFELLGKGAFGIVVKCRKKSTGRMYAMKIVGKQVLIESYADNMSMVTIEVKTLAAVRHPFIIGMDYSFQTANSALIVMELSEGGTLKSITRYFRNHLLKERHIRFYIAEIAEALHYLHGIGLVYRDLKPANVLVGLDGHIKLADLGGVSEATRKAVIRNDDEEDVGALNVYAWTGTKLVYNTENLSEPVRKRSILGTRGYMAPEMLELALSNRRGTTGYSYMVDWWSLGCLVYALLHGVIPFRIKKEEYTTESEFDLVSKGDFALVDTRSEECISFMRDLLVANDVHRLGYGLEGLNNIKAHSFMAVFDWANVMKRQCRPPIIPQEDVTFQDVDQYYCRSDFEKETPVYKSYEMLPLPDWSRDDAKSQELPEVFSEW
jgi:serine/threonine protein kinase